MDAHKRTLEEILSPSIRLVAPLFQRPYVWNEERNWVPLWGALVEQMERRERGSGRPYFLGALVLDDTPMPCGSVVMTRREIIDGQQRLTTLQILFRAAMDALAEHGLNYEADQLKGLVFNNLRQRSDERFKVWPTNVDREQYRAAMDGEPAEGLLVAGRAFFRARVGELLSDPETRERRAEIFLQTVTQGLVFAAIDLDKEDDSQLIFETLNSLGTPLLPSDLVKNLLFRAALEQGLNTEELYAKHWLPFESDAEYWRALLTNRKRTRLDIFLQHYLGLVLAREPSASGLFRAYQDHYAEGGFGDVESALAHFARHASLYRAFDESKGQDAEAELRRIFHWTNTGTLLPVVLGISARVEDAAERSGMYQILESYLARRLVCNVQSQGLNKIGYEIVARLDRSGWTAVSLRDFLLAQGGVTFAWPHDEWVCQAARWKPAYTAIPARRLAYLYVRLEEALASTKSEDIGPLKVASMTVEHLMPRKWEDHWPLPENAEADAADRRNESLHRFGNLTIIKGELNSAMRNAAWPQKREALIAHSTLLMNNRLSTLDLWDEAAIAKRGEEIGAAFCRIWPRD